MNKLHFKTTIKRIKDLMLSEDFNEFKVIETLPAIFTLNFPNGEEITINLNCSHLGDMKPGSLYYNNGTEFGSTSDNMDITWKFTFAVWNKLTLDNPVVGPHDNFVKRQLNDWARRVQRGYAKTLWDNKTILGA